MDINSVDNTCRKKKKRRYCLINVDIQNDFITGALALKDAPAGQDGAEVVPIVNQLIRVGSFDLVVYSLDFHPSDHISFVDNAHRYVSHTDQLNNARSELMVDIPPYGVIHQRLWPRHCVQGTSGSCLSSDLYIKPTAVFVHKGGETLIESYSVFGNDKMNYDTGLNKLLQSTGITDIYFAGLAEDVCVGYSVLDALRLGYTVTVIEDATRGVNTADCSAIRQRILQRGGNYESSDSVLSRLQHVSRV